MRHFPLFLFLAFFLSFNSGADSRGNTELVEKVVVSWDDTTRMSFLVDGSMTAQGWDTLQHARFWKDVICLSSDTCIINIASCRKPVDRISRLVWMNQTEPEKLTFKDSLCRVIGLEPETEIYITAGKQEFYEVKKTMASIHKAIPVFEKNGCDPWYAQAILLIESPGKHKAKSYVGANGPFQLMRSVAIRYGLKVNKYTDERTNLEKSAKAAAALINKSCIPYIKKFLDDYCIEYNETDLWFRLLVLHAYHAGAGNVRCVLDALQPTTGGIDLFLKIWQTTCGGFKNESQNYSQIAIASMLNFENLISEYGDTVFLVSGDRMMRSYTRVNAKAYDAYGLLTSTMKAYERDFVDEMIPFDYFMKKIEFIRGELTWLANSISISGSEVVLKKYPAAEEHLIFLAGQLTKRQRYEDAIRLLKVNLDMYPGSTLANDSIAKLYRLTGDLKSAEFYSSRSAKDSRNLSLPRTD